MIERGEVAACRDLTSFFQSPLAWYAQCTIIVSRLSSMAPLETPMPRTRSKSQTDAARAFAVEAAQLLADRKCNDIRLIDVRGLSQVCDYTLIASGTSERQMKSIADELEELGAERGMTAFRRDADAGNTWVVVDCVDVVTHLFEPNTRFYYDLESLWAEAPLIDWRRADQTKTHRFEGPIGLAANADGEAE